MFFFPYPIFTLLAYFTVLLGTHSISYISYFLRLSVPFSHDASLSSLPFLPMAPPPFFFLSPFFFAISPSADPSGRGETFDGRWVIYSNADMSAKHVSFFCFAYIGNAVAFKMRN